MKLNEYIHYDGLGLAQLIEKKEVQRWIRKFEQHL